MNEERTCLHCKDKIKGRSDKKFCGDGCRNAYNNRLNEKQNGSIRKVNSILKSNRRILEKMMQDKGSHLRITRQALINRGFRLNFHTHQLKSPKGNKYFFSYEFGIRILGDEVIIVKSTKGEGRSGK